MRLALRRARCLDRWSGDGNRSGLERHFFTRRPAVRFFTLPRAGPNPARQELTKDGNS
jgi:hypothetical protein